MNFLSLQEPEPISSRHLTRTESILVSVVAHLLILLLLLGANRLRDYLPESILALFEENPSSLTIAQMAAADDESVQPPEASSDKIPLEFTYVKVPKDTAVDRNPDAPLLSDKNRRARQEILTPEDATLFSIDPHSEGDSIDRVSPDPAIPEGEDSPDPQHPGEESVDEPVEQTPEQIAEAGGDRGSGIEVSEPGEQGLSTVPPPEENGPGTTGGEGSGGLAGPGDGTARDPGEQFRRALAQIKTGEYKFTFDNPAYLEGGSFGTLSFDTQEFPWGDYARRIYVIIRNNWFRRIPLAAREGIRGYSCQHFVIARDGSVVEVTTTRRSKVPPFNKAAAGAIEASSPLPELPSDFPHESEGVTYCFFYNMYPQEIR